MSAKERRERALRLERMRSDVAVVEPDAEEICDENSEVSDAPVVVADSVRKPVSNAKRERLRKSFGIAKQKPERRANWVEVTDDITEALEFMLAQKRFLSGWECDFVDSIVDFAAANSGLTAKQWHTAMDILKRLQYRL